jgi:hypothetical protein
MAGERTVKARVEGWTQNPSNDQQITVEYMYILSNGEDSHHGSTMMPYVPAYAFEGIGKGDTVWITTCDGRINPKTNNPYRDFQSVSKTPPNHHDGANGYANGGPESPIEPRSGGSPMEPSDREDGYLQNQARIVRQNQSHLCERVATQMFLTGRFKDDAEYFLFLDEYSDHRTAEVMKRFPAERDEWKFFPPVAPAPNGSVPPPAPNDLDDEAMEAALREDMEREAMERAGLESEVA